MKFRLCEGNGVCFYYLGKPCVRLRLRFCVTSRNGITSAGSGSPQANDMATPGTPSAPLTAAGVEDNGNLLGLEAGDLAVSLDTLHAMTREVSRFAGRTTI